MTTSADEYKELGNKAFAAKDFKTAIEYYSKAIQSNPSNHVFFSNRSASYGSLKQWDRAISDAKECIKLEPIFLKGYYRLATAQMAIEDWDAASATLKQGIAVEPNNPQLLKQMQQLKQQKKLSEAVAASKKKRLQQAAAAAQANGGGGGGGNKTNSNDPTMAGNGNGQLQLQFDAATAREYQELQLQQAQARRDHQVAQTNLIRSQKEMKAHQITLDELAKLDAETSCSSSSTKMYRAVGKMFVASSRPDIVDHLEASISRGIQQEKEMTQKMEYLERQVTSQQQNMDELAKTARANASSLPMDR